MIGWYDSFEHVKQKLLVWVARQDQEDYLKTRGYLGALAIGLPIIYLPERHIRRIQGSLLVMPAHSINETTQSWNIASYLRTIYDVRDRFSDIVVCLHASCWGKDNVRRAFQDGPFPVIQGAGGEVNALHRMQQLLSTFEYVTSNSSGSHMAYGAFFGAKVSIFGKYAELSKADLQNHITYKKYPWRLALDLASGSEQNTLKHFPFLFGLPWEVKQQIEWGREQVGYASRKNPEELKKLFGWAIHRRVFKLALVRRAAGRLYGFTRAQAQRLRPCIARHLNVGVEAKP